LPLTLIKKIVRFRLKENEQKQILKKKKWRKQLLWPP
jgi:hypothetical protein